MLSFPLLTLSHRLPYQLACSQCSQPVGHKELTPYQRIAYEKAGFFSSRTASCSLTIRYMLSGAFFLSACSLTVLTLLTASVTPWMLLFAVPYFFLGAGLGYELAQSLPSPRPSL